MKKIILVAACYTMTTLFSSCEEKREGTITGVAVSLTEKEKEDLVFDKNSEKAVALNVTFDDSTKTKALIIKKDFAKIKTFPVRATIHSGGICGCPTNVELSGK